MNGSTELSELNEAPQRPWIRSQTSAVPSHHATGVFAVRQHQPADPAAKVVYRLAPYFAVEGVFEGVEPAGELIDHAGKLCPGRLGILR